MIPVPVSYRYIVFVPVLPVSDSNATNLIDFPKLLLEGSLLSSRSSPARFVLSNHQAWFDKVIIIIFVIFVHQLVLLL